MTEELKYEWLQLMRAEYLEVPGLALTKPQAQRLWGLDARACDALLEEMVAERFLRKSYQDRYVRADIAC